jgi:hypothetical protein
MLSSETHFTEKSYLKLFNHTNPLAGTATIIKNSIKHHQLNNYSQDFLQTTSVSVEDSVGLLTFSAVYLPLKHSKARATRTLLQQDENTMLSITTGDPD